ncbi:MAG: hypothetical protein R6W88_05100 [Desulfobacterales bacterium]
MRLPDQEKLKKERIQDALSTNTQLIEHEKKLGNLFKKRDAIEGLMPGLLAEIKTAEQEKHFVIDEYCNDKCTVKDLETAKKNYDLAVIAEKEKAGFLTVVNKKINDLNAKLNDVREKKLTAEQLVWELLSEETNEDLKEKLGDLILWAYSVNLKRPTPLSYEDFLQTVVFPNPEPHDMERFDADLEAFYQTTLNG